LTSLTTTTTTMAAASSLTPTSPPASASATTSLTITRPDDWHLHVRDGPQTLSAVVPATAAVFGRAVIMPNLVPPVTSVEGALSYLTRIEQAIPSSSTSHHFRPRMALYLTDKTTPADVEEAAAKKDIIHGYKLYPAGATTNSDSGVTDLTKLHATLQAMEELGVPLMVHGEVTDAEVDVFDREREFIQRVLGPLLVEKYLNLKIVMEHITTD